MIDVCIFIRIGNTKFKIVTSVLQFFFVVWGIHKIYQTRIPFPLRAVKRTALNLCQTWLLMEGLAPTNPRKRKSGGLLRHIILLNKVHILLFGLAVWCCNKCTTCILQILNNTISFMDGAWEFSFEHCLKGRDMQRLQFKFSQYGGANLWLQCREKSWWPPIFHCHETGDLLLRPGTD